MMNVKRFTQTRPAGRAPVAWLVLVVGMALLSGCGGEGDEGMSVKKPATERPDVDQTTAAKGALTVPAHEAFNLTSFKSGQTGAARGESQALGNDGATCRAEARDGGSAWASFQLGYCFDNTAGLPLDAAVRLRLTANESTSGQRAGADAVAVMTTAESTLTFFIKDTNGVVIKKEDLLSSSLEKGPDSLGTTHDLVFDARFEPNRGYYLVLAGRTDVKADASQSVAASLSVAQCSLEVEWRGASAPGGAEGALSPDADTSASATDADRP